MSRDKPHPRPLPGPPAAITFRVTEDPVQAEAQRDAGISLWGRLAARAQMRRKPTNDAKGIIGPFCPGE